MKMKRGITTLLSVAVLSTSLVACSGTPWENSGERRESKINRTTINGWFMVSNSRWNESTLLPRVQHWSIKAWCNSCKRDREKPAIVLDLDETVLDNSPHQAMSVKQAKAILTNGMIGLTKLRLKPFQAQLIS